MRTEHKHLLCVICTPTHHRKEFHRCPTHLYNTPQLPESFTHSHVVENQFHMQKEGYFLMLWDRPDMEWDLGLRVKSTFVHALGGYTLTIHSYACTNMLMTLYYTLYTSNIGVHTYIHTYTSCVWSFVCTFKCDVYNLHAVWSTLLFICK